MPDWTRKRFDDIEDRSPADVDMQWRFARWDVLRVGPSVGRQFEAGPDGMEVVCIGGPVPDGGDGEPVENFWD